MEGGRKKFTKLPTIDNRKTNGSLNRSMDNTFGDEYRKYVKEFFQAYRQEESLSLEGQVYYLRTLADTHKRSAMETQNVYNILRASGLLNLCLVKIGDPDADIYQEILSDLTAFEISAMRRVLKIKSNGIALFDRMKCRDRHLSELTEIRSVFNADMALLESCIKNIPDLNSVYNSKSSMKSTLLNDNRIISIVKTMFTECHLRKMSLLDSIVRECEQILGPAPCQYVLTANSRWRFGVHSPYEPISCFLLIEKSGANHRIYFRTLLTLFGMKIINLGETSLNLLNMKSLNWYTEEMEKRSGLALYDFIDDTEKKYFTSIPIESVFTIKELRRAAMSNNMSERSAVKEICDEIYFVSGDTRLFKELSSLRQTVVQREHSDKDFKVKVFDRLTALTKSADPFDYKFFYEQDLETIHENVFSFVFHFFDIMFDLDKTLVSTNPINRIEECRSESCETGYAYMEIRSETVNDQLVSFLSPLPDLQKSALEKKPSTKSMTIHTASQSKTSSQGSTLRSNEMMSEDSEKNDEPEHTNVLRRLKNNKQVVANSTSYYRGYMTKSSGETIGYSNPVKSSRSSELRLSKSRDTGLNGKISVYDDDDDDDAEPELMNLKNNKSKRKFDPSKRAMPKNASNRVAAIAAYKQKQAKGTPVKEAVETRVPYDRCCTTSPIYFGALRNIFRPGTFDQMLLLYSLSAYYQMMQNSMLIVSTNNKRPQIGQKSLDVVYLKMINILLPVLEHLKQSLTDPSMMVRLRKSFISLEIPHEENDLALAVTFYHNFSFQKCCNAICRSLEKVSDVTFIGDPYPIDLSEVCEELLEEGVISLNRYEATHLLMGHSQMMMDNFDHAYEYFAIILPILADPKSQGYVHLYMTQCCMSLEKYERALSQSERAIASFASTVKVDPSVKAEINLAKTLRGNINRHLQLEQ